MIRVLTVVLFFTSLMPVLPVKAEEIDVMSDFRRTENCLQFSENQNDCIGSFAGNCSELPNRGSFEGMRTCTDTERDYWVSRSNKTLAILIEKAEIDDFDNSDVAGFTSMVEGYQEMHRGFEIFRDASCLKQRESFLFDEPAEAELFESHCLMKMDGEQSNYLELVLSDGQ